MKNFLHFAVTTFGFSDFNDFYHSIIHIKLLAITVPAALAFASVASLYFGFTPLIFISFGLLAFLEILTGIVAAKIKGEIIQSKKMSRFGLKIFVFMTLFFITNSLAKGYDTHGFNNQLMYLLFYGVHISLVSWVSFEYLISVLENLSVITGKTNNKLIKFLKFKRDSLLVITEIKTEIITEIKTEDKPES